MCECDQYCVLTVFCNDFGGAAYLRRHIHNNSGILLGIIHHALLNEIPDEQKKTENKTVINAFL